MTTHKMKLFKRAVIALSLFVGLSTFTYIDSLLMGKALQESAIKLNYPIYGIDVSKHTNQIDWEMVKRQEVRFAYLKATEGATYVDPKFEQFYRGAKENGVLVSAYHFFRFDKTGAEQAENFMKTVDVQNLDLLPVLDIEEAVTYNRTNNVAPVIQEIKSFLDTIEVKYGIKMILYSNEQGYNKYIRDYFPTHEIWICALKQQPSIERGWIFWQFSHTTKLEGVRYPVDMNIFYGCNEAWEQYVQASTLALRNKIKREPFLVNEELSLIKK